MSLTEVRVKALENRVEFLARAVRNLTDELRAVEQQLRAIEGLGTGAYGSSGGSINGIYFQAPAGGIPGRSGLTLGSATCEVFGRSGTAIADQSTTALVVNVSTGAVGANKYGFAAWDGVGYVVVVESCA